MDLNKGAIYLAVRHQSPHGVTESLIRDWNSTGQKTEAPLLGPQRLQSGAPSLRQTVRGLQSEAFSQRPPDRGLQSGASSPGYLVWDP